MTIIFLDGNAEEKMSDDSGAQHYVELLKTKIFHNIYKKVARSEDRTHDLLFTKEVHCHCAIRANWSR